MIASLSGVAAMERTTVANQTVTARLKYFFMEFLCVDCLERSLTRKGKSKKEKVKAALVGTARRAVRSGRSKTEDAAPRRPYPHGSGSGPASAGSSGGAVGGAVGAGAELTTGMKGGLETAGAGWSSLEGG